MPKPDVTVLLPNYRTPQITPLCVGLLRRYTDAARLRIVAIDNGSGAGEPSLVWLRAQADIHLIEREPHSEPTWIAHAKALDLALGEVDTPFVLSIHTDTFVQHHGWLDFLLAPFDKAEVAAVGSWKLEHKPAWKYWAKALEKRLPPSLRGRAGGDDKPSMRYLRSHCAMYRSDVLRQLDIGFSAGDGRAGKAIHQALLAAGYESRFFSAPVLSQYLLHLNHATTVLNPQLGSKTRSVLQGQRRLRRTLRRLRQAGGPLSGLDHPPDQH